MSHIEIAKKAILKPIAELAQEKLGIETRHFDPYGQYKAKLSLEYTGGKTITTVGLGDALNRLGIGALAVG
ncbi:MAG: formate--tetrahydrofolate ligase, partial [Gammaproteobacteria bacterium]